MVVGVIYHIINIIEGNGKMSKKVKKLLTAIMTAALMLGTMSGTVMAYEYNVADEPDSVFSIMGLATSRSDRGSSSLSAVDRNSDEVARAYSHLKAQYGTSSTLVHYFKVKASGADEEEPVSVRIVSDKIVQGRSYASYTYDSSSSTWSSSTTRVSKASAGSITLSMKKSNVVVAIVQKSSGGTKAGKAVGASSIIIEGDDEIEFRKSVKLKATVKPDDVIDKTVKWSLKSGNGIVVDNGDGKCTVTCMGSGNIKVQAMAANGKKKIFTIKGPKAPSSVKIEGDTKADMGEVIELEAEVLPDETPDKRVEWTVLKGAGEIVSSTDTRCKVKCTGAGDIRVQARTLANNKKKTFTIKGPKAASSVKITGDKTVEFNEIAELEAEVKPENAPDKSVEWTVVRGNGQIIKSNDTICKVKCIGAGDIRVQAKTVTNKKSTFTIKGPKAVTSVKIEGDKDIAYQKTVTLTAEVKPENAPDKSLTWSIAKGAGEIVKSDNNKCVVKSVGAGDIKVQAVANATGKKGTFTLKGPKAATSVKIEGERKIEIDKTVKLTAVVYPEEAINKDVTWELISGKGEIVSADAKTCVVKCNEVGDIKIRATTVTGKKATITIKGPKVNK